MQGRGFIVSRILNLVHGEINVTSKLGEGSNFTVIFSNK